MSDISVDLGSLLPYVEERVRGLFGADYQSREAGARLEKHLRIAARDAAMLQIVGMDRPVPLFEIYQPTKLTSIRGDERELHVDDVLAKGLDLVIFGGPGAGKTVFSRYVFANLTRHGQGVIPVLFTLRWPNASVDLAAFVDDLASQRLRRLTKSRILLLVDGYDEIGEDERDQVVTSLRQYGALDVGTYVVTCRRYYNVDRINGHQFSIDPFRSRDSIQFVRAFAKAYGVTLDPTALLNELHEHGFDDFASHPLLLTLVCILRSGPLPRLPRTAIGLIRRAISTLTLRWDEAKGVRRESRLEIDGEDRVRCMMRIAFNMPDLVASDQRVQEITRIFLRLVQKPDINPQVFLTELAQWYGMLVPVSDNTWGFVHRTIHDYLAASFWVESGKFDPKVVTSWNSRAAYAACLLPDATASLLAILATVGIGPAFLECLNNGALFDPKPVGIAVLDHISTKKLFTYKRDGVLIRTKLENDLCAAASIEFLETLVTIGLSAQTPPHEAILSQALAELHERKIALSSRNRAQLLVAYPLGATFDVAVRNSSVRIDTTQVARTGGA